MMDFDNILSIASQNQGLSSVQQKRYSLQTGPPKKDPGVKGVKSTAVQAFLKKKQLEVKQKEMQMRKDKEELTAKRVELKSDRKARAMASRTKDNFKGYNGVPVVEEPKKRRSKGEVVDERPMINCYDPGDDEDNYEYEPTDSEPEQEQEPVRPRKDTGGSGSGFKAPAKRSTGTPKPAPPPLNYADLIKLAEKKQFEPVEVKAKPVKSEGRLRTADEIRELELERKAKRHDKGKDSRPERESSSQSGSSSFRKSASEKEQKNGKPQKSSSEKPTASSLSGKKSKSMSSDGRDPSSSKPSLKERDRDERPKSALSDRDRPKTSMSCSSGALNSKPPSKGPPSQVLAKQSTPRPSPGHKASTASDLSSRKGNSTLPQGRPGSNPISRPPSAPRPAQKSQPQPPGHPRPSQGGSLKGASTSGAHNIRKSEPVRPGVNATGKTNNNGLVRPSSGVPPRPGGHPPVRPGGVPQGRTGVGPLARPGGSSLQGHPQGGARPSGNGAGRAGNMGQPPGRPAHNPGSGPGRPKCTVVSETISSKNMSGGRPGGPPRPGAPPGPGVPQRPGMAARPGAMPYGSMPRTQAPQLPPITSAYKRKYEEEEYDSEMDDFIDNADEEQEEVSKHIREIFGYDRSKYKEESDYALRFMESSWRDLQKEEARSLRMAVQEDLEEERREEEELKKKNAKRKKL